MRITVTSYSRGNKIYYDGLHWRYFIDNSIHDDSKSCRRCGRMPTEEGGDACIGHLEGVTSACCGHGVEHGYIIKE